MGVKSNIHEPPPALSMNTTTPRVPVAIPLHSSRVPATTPRKHLSQRSVPIPVAIPLHFNTVPAITPRKQLSQCEIPIPVAIPLHFYETLNRARNRSSNLPATDCAASIKAIVENPPTDVKDLLGAKRSFVMGWLEDTGKAIHDASSAKLEASAPEVLGLTRHETVLLGAGGKKETGMTLDNVTFIDTLEKLKIFLPLLSTQLKKTTSSDILNQTPEVFIDCEGWDLGRLGTLSLLQLTIEPFNHTWIIDITVLRQQAFETLEAGWSLRTLLESETIAKVFWDVRSDSEALFHHYDIRLRGVQDLQLMENLTRSGSRFCLSSLAEEVDFEGERSEEMTEEEVMTWTRIKREGSKFFKSNPKGYGVFDERPLSEMAMKYAGQDTTCMPMLWRVYSKRLPASAAYRKLLIRATEERIRDSWRKEIDECRGCGPTLFWPLCLDTKTWPQGPSEWDLDRTWVERQISKGALDESWTMLYLKAAGCDIIKAKVWDADTLRAFVEGHSRALTTTSR
jgi:exonuclease 3'-5' domain-containing protein 1